MNKRALKLYGLVLLAGVFIAAFGVVGRVVAETWNSVPHTFNVPVTVTSSFTKSPPANKTAAFTVDLTESKYHIDTTAGAFVISLPDATAAATTPANGQCWEFTLTVANGAASLSPSAVGNLLDASQAAYAGIDAVGDAATVCYDSGTADYYFQSRYIH